MIVLLVWLAALATSVVFNFTSVLAARMLGARAQAAAFFLGPKIVRFSVATVPVEIKAVPVPSGYVVFEPSPTRSDDDPARTQLHDLSRPRRLAIVIVPWIAAALVCAIVLGPDVAVGSIGRGFVQYFHGALFPGSVGRELVARLVELAQEEPWYRFGARFATKLIAFNLLPLPGIAGFSFWFELVRGRRATPPGWLSVVGSLVLAAAAVGWIWAIAAYALAH